MDDASKILANLDPAAMRVRLEELEAERQSLLVLLRATRYRRQREGREIIHYSGPPAEGQR